MIIDDNSYLYLSSNMHVVSLKYIRAVQSLNTSTFIQFDRMVGIDEKHTTNPKGIL